MNAKKYAFDSIEVGEDLDLLNSQKKVQDAAPPKKQGRPADPKGTKVSLTLQTEGRMENAPLVIVKGSGRRKNIKYVNLPVPEEVYNRIKTSGGNISASLVALMVFGLETLDKENKTLWASYTKEIGKIK